MPSPPDRDRGATAVAVSLFVVWLVHDVEEALTMPATTARLADQLAGSRWAALRSVSGRLRTRPDEARTAIALMGVVVVAASVRGLATGGRSPFFQAVVAGLQAHVLSHLAVSLRLRGCSSGVVTAVLLVAPWSVWARRVLRARGVLVEGPRPHLQGLLLLLPLALGCHAVARVLRRSTGGAVTRAPGPLSSSAAGG